MGGSALVSSCTEWLNMVGHGHLNNEHVCAAEEKKEKEKKGNNGVSLQWTVAHITMQCFGRINTKD